MTFTLSFVLIEDDVIDADCDVDPNPAEGLTSNNSVTVAADPGCGYVGATGPVGDRVRWIVTESNAAYVRTNVQCSGTGAQSEPMIATFPFPDADNPIPNTFGLNFINTSLGSSECTLTNVAAALLEPTPVPTMNVFGLLMLVGLLALMTG